MLKEINVEKSVVYNNITNKLDGLYLGQIGYFSDTLSFGSYETNQLYDIVTSSAFRYRTPTGDKFAYFIPADKVVFKEKPKKLRPYKDISEFCNETGCEEIGVDIINIRSRDTKHEDVLLYTGYCNNAVHLGGYILTLESLFNHYEFLCEDDWLPFGIEE